jgi:hypothetical protein
MRAPTGRRFRAAAALAGLLLAAGSALACPCRPLALSTRIVGADLIMVGRVSEVEPPPRITVQPVEILKGRVPRSDAVTISPIGSDCDFFLPPVEPKVGEEFLLYLRKAKGVKDQFIASRCMQSGPMPEKADELAAVRKRLRAKK